MTDHDARPEQVERAEDAGDPGTSAALPHWVLWCWPTSWRRSYGDEMADTWADCDGTRRGLALLAGQGLWQRVVRPRTAAGVIEGDPEPRESHPVHPTGSTEGADLALVAGPRMVLRTLTAMATALAVIGVELLLLVTIEAVPASLSGDGAAISAEVGRQQGMVTASAMMVPLATAAFGERLTRRRATRDQGIGVVLGAVGVLWPAFLIPAVAAVVLL